MSLRAIIALLLACLVSAPASAMDAEALLRAGKIAEAVPVAAAEAKAAPDDLARQERWIDLMLGLGLPAVVQTHYAQRVQAHPTDADAHYLVGRAATTFTASLEAYEHALSFDPDHARSFMGIGALHRASGKLREAAEAYQRALRLDPSLAEAWAGLLATVMPSGDPATILEVARAALVQAPDLAEAWLALATYDPKTAGETLTKAVAQVPYDARVHAARADQLLRSGDAAGAAREADEALRIDPLNKGARLTRMFAMSIRAGTLDLDGAQALVAARTLATDDPAAGVAALDAVVADHPDSPLPWLVRASARTEDPQAAEDDLRHALALDPDNDEAEAALGLLLQASGAAVEAAGWLDRAVAARPWDRSLGVACSEAHAAAGQGEQALAAIARTADRHPWDVDVALRHIHLTAAVKGANEAWKLAQTLRDRLPDTRVGLAAAAAAADAGRYLDAADAYDDLARKTGQPVFAETAKHLRARAAN